jgi:hypothetical protein
MSVAEPGGGSAGFRWRPPTQMRQAPTKRTGVGSFTLDRYSSSTREDRVHLELGSASRGSRRRRQRPARYQCLSAQASNGILVSAAAACVDGTTRTALVRERRYAWTDRGTDACRPCEENSGAGRHCWQVTLILDRSGDTHPILRYMDVSKIQKINCRITVSGYPASVQPADWFSPGPLSRGRVHWSKRRSEVVDAVSRFR